MSKFVYVCARHSLPDSMLDALASICARLVPDHVTPRVAKLRRSGNIAFAIANPSEVCLEVGDSILSGCIYGMSPDWSRPGTARPDGSYALVRADSAAVEVVSDPAGSRTMWTCWNDEMFVCSSSQRAIVMLIGSIDVDERVVPWMLSTGTLGPTLSWDRRITRLQADSSLTIDRSAWTVTVDQTPVRFTSQKRSRDQHRARLELAIDSTFAADWSFRPEALVVPLSGGYDSRCILRLLQRSRQERTRLETITWGLESKRAIPGSDAWVAARVAAELGVANRFIALDEVAATPEEVLARFITHSEGRIDHIAGYMDGMNLWRLLHEAQVQAIVRGDEGFGWTPCATERAARYSAGLGLVSDYSNLESLCRQFGIEPNELPGHLRRMPGETIPTWRDRLYHMNRIPTMLAALTDLKLAYVEVLNPLLSRRILQEVRLLPDKLRTSKALFKEIADLLGPAIPFASVIAIESTSEIVARPEYSALIARTLLDAVDNHPLLPAGMLRKLAADMGQQTPRVSTAANRRNRRFLSIFPRSMRNRFRDFRRKTLDTRVLGLRAFILMSMLKLLNEDCGILRGRNIN